SWTSSPGTKKRYESSALIRNAPLSNGPNSSRKYSGCMRPTISQTGLRSTRVIWRANTSQVSRTSFISGSFRAVRAVAQGSAGLGQEHVVEARPVQLDGAERDIGAVQGAQDLRDRGRAGIDVQPEPVVEGLHLADIWLAVEQCGGLRGGAVQPDCHDVTG